MTPETTQKIITVFGSSRTQPGTPGYENAVALGKALAQAGFTIANGKLTPTLKLRRHVIGEKYRPALEALYR